MIAPATPKTVQERALRVLAGLPPLSPILNRLLSSLAQQEVSFAKISDLIEKDAVLAGNILSLVNSALYGRRGTIDSIRHAVALLGVNKLRNAALTMSVSRMWNHVKAPTGWSMGKFNLHSAGVGILADQLSQKLPVDYAEGAFAAGLFHDIGWLLIALGCQEEFNQASALRRENGNWNTELELQVFGITHADLSAEALAVWKLPEPIQTAVRYHRTPDLDSSAVTPQRVPLSRIIYVADQYVQALGGALSVFEEDAQPVADLPDYLALGEKRAKILADFETEFSAIQQYF